jgi:hypothetical protein
MNSKNKMKLVAVVMDVNYFCRLAPAILAGGRQVHGSCLV